VGWRKMEWPFARATALTMTDPSFTDEELGELDRLADFEALDLEGTGISDEGLQHLRGLKRLRFLVLRRTQVTASAVQKLQNDLPRTMIWI
jgi:hypothetical protein